MDPLLHPVANFWIFLDPPTPFVDLYHMTVRQTITFEPSTFENKVTEIEIETTTMTDSDHV